jgi:hypothetical protein
MAFKSTNFYYDNKSGIALTSSDSLTPNQSSLQSSVNSFEKVGGPAAGDTFGLSVAVGSNRIVVGTPNDDTNGNSSGIVSVYDLDYTHLFNITGSTANNSFGYRVAVGENRIAVRWINSGTSTVTVYDLSGNFLFTKSESTDTAEFGNNLAIGHNKILISSPYRTVSGVNTPTVFMYDLDGNLIKDIRLSSATFTTNFSKYPIAVGSERIVISNPGANGPSGTPNQGIVWIYDIDGNLIKEIGEPSQSGPYLDFGDSVAVGNGRIVVVQNQQLMLPGKFYIYDLNGNLVKGPIVDIYHQTNTYDTWGCSVAISGTTIIFNRPGGLNYNGNNSNKASVDFYDLNGNFLFTVDLSSITNYDNFYVAPEAMSVNSGRIVIGAYGHASSATLQQSGKVITLEIPDAKDIFSLF